jgi:hypothetical protein
MAEHVIFHYEDEPHRVDFPGKIEVALYQHPDVERSSIDEAADLQEFRIEYRMKGEDHSVRYVIEESITAAEQRGKARAETAMLHLVSLRIGADPEAGVQIVEELQRRGVADDRIWVVTAYEAQARQDARLAGLRVFPKPSPLGSMVETILGFLGTEDDG